MGFGLYQTIMTDMQLVTLQLLTVATQDLLQLRISSAPDDHEILYYDRCAHLNDPHAALIILLILYRYQNLDTLLHHNRAEIFLVNIKV